jgi:SAM-dependent methyltransferase
MVDHAGRLAILGEIRRLLKPGGFFVFSTYNQDSADHHQSLELPGFTPSLNPVRLLRSLLGFARSTAVRLRNRARLRRFEVRSAEYSIVNDRCHDYATLLYYITLPNQRRQLAQAGFEKPATVYDGSGLPVASDTRDSSITFVVEG